MFVEYRKFNNIKNNNASISTSFTNLIVSPHGGYFVAISRDNGMLLSLICRAGLLEKVNNLILYVNMSTVRLQYRQLGINPLAAKLFNWNFHPLEVVSRWRDSQLQVSENYSDLTKWRLTNFKSCWLMSRFIFDRFKSWYVISNKKCKKN